MLRTFADRAARRTTAAIRLAPIAAVVGAALLTNAAPADAAAPDHYNNVVTWSLTQVVRHGPEAWKESQQFGFSGSVFVSAANRYDAYDSGWTSCVGTWGGANAYHGAEVTKSAPSDRGVNVALRDTVGTGTFQCFPWSEDKRTDTTVTIAGNTSKSVTTTAENPADGDKVTTTWTITNTVVADNTIPPASSADRYTTDYGTAVSTDAAHGVLANDSDPNGNPLTAQLVSRPTSGSLYFNNNGSFTYSPNAGFSGADTFTYRANNGTVSGPVTTVYLSTLPKHPSPTANPDSYTVRSGSVLTVTGSGVLGNDASPSRLPLQAYLIGNPAHGQLILDENGSFSYRPAAGFTGTDTFTYQDYDGSGIYGFSAPTTVTINVI